MHVCADPCAAFAIVSEKKLALARLGLSLAQALRAASARISEKKLPLRASDFPLRSLARPLRRICALDSSFGKALRASVFSLRGLARNELGILLDGFVLDDFVFH